MIIAKESIPVNTTFGPLIAPLVNKSDMDQGLVRYSVKVPKKPIHHFNLESNSECNWMKLVRFAENVKEQNVSAYILNGQVFFLVTKPVEEGQELKVWYSKEYARSIGKPAVPEPTTTDESRRYPSRVRKPKVKPDAAEPESSGTRKRKASTPRLVNDTEECGNISVEKQLLGAVYEQTANSSEEDAQAAAAISTSDVANGERESAPEIADDETGEPSSKRQRLDQSKPAFRCVTVVRASDGSEVVRPLRPPRPRVRPVPRAEKPPKAPAPRSLPYQYHCPECGLYWQLEELLDLHNFKHAPPPLTEDMPVRKCPKCPFARKDTALMAHHVREHAWNQTQVEAHIRKSKCDHCPGSFSDLAKHMYTVHRKEYLALTEFDGLPLIHQCQYCEMKFTTRHALQGHTQMHTKAGDYSQCVICLQQFQARTIELREHLETHLVDEHWACRLCGRKYRLYNSLCEHMRVMHDPSRTSQCPICQKVCRTAEKLKRHVETHNTTCNYACELCGKTFKSKSYVKYHLTYTHGMKKRVKRRGDDLDISEYYVEEDGDEEPIDSMDGNVEDDGNAVVQAVEETISQTEVEPASAVVEARPTQSVRAVWVEDAKAGLVLLEAPETA